MAVTDEGTNRHLRVKCTFADQLTIDQSVAHNGVCLTVVALNPDGTYTQRGQDVIRQTPFGRMGDPEELCGTIHYLMSDAAKFVTGTVAVVDGGFNVLAM